MSKTVKRANILCCQRFRRSILTLPLDEGCGIGAERKKKRRRCWQTHTRGDASAGGAASQRCSEREKNRCIRAESPLSCARSLGNSAVSGERESGTERHRNTTGLKQLAHPISRLGDVSACKFRRCTRALFKSHLNLKIRSRSRRNISENLTRTFMHTHS